MKRIFRYLLPNLALMQVFTWILLFGLWTLYLYSKWNSGAYAFFGGLTSFIFYVLATYVNYLYLIPHVLRRRGWWAYAGVSAVTLTVLIILRMRTEHLVLLPIHGFFYDMRPAHFWLDAITTSLAFLFGALLRLTIDYIQLAQRQKDLEAKQTSTELKLLKAQVQPHFLYNTLNNIYYLALSKDDKAPEAIAKLSETMRYFTDEAHKDKVPLSTEIQLITNYMELERLRMPHHLQIHFDKDRVDHSLMVPPMLLMPLVENVYKHGIDKTMMHNEVKITLHKEDNTIVFTTSNGIPSTTQMTDSRKGLQNLRERLQILYGRNYELNVSSRDNRFDALLKFPVT